MKRTLVFTYGLVNYVVFLGTFLYLAGFVGNLFRRGRSIHPQKGRCGQRLSSTHY